MPGETEGTNLYFRLILSLKAKPLGDSIVPFQMKEAVFFWNYIITAISQRICFLETSPVFLIAKKIFKYALEKFIWFQRQIMLKLPSNSFYTFEEFLTPGIVARSFPFVVCVSHIFENSILHTLKIPTMNVSSFNHSL